MSEAENRRPLASRDTGWARMLTRRIAATSITPNGISMASIAFAALSGLGFWLAGDAEGPLRPALLILAALCCQLRLLCNLLDGMVEVLLGDVTRTGDANRPGAVTRPDDAHEGTSGGDWRAAFGAAIAAVRDLHRAHPWLRRVFETRTLRTPAVLTHMERLTSLLLVGGFSADLTHHVMHLLGNRIWGFSPELFNESAAERRVRRTTASAPDPDDYPGILAVAADAHTRRPHATGCDEDFEFTFALDVLLDAAERLRRSGWSSPA